QGGGTSHGSWGVIVQVNRGAPGARTGGPESGPADPIGPGQAKNLAGTSCRPSQPGLRWALLPLGQLAESPPNAPPAFLPSSPPPPSSTWVLFLKVRGTAIIRVVTPFPMPPSIALSPRPPVG